LEKLPIEELVARLSSLKILHNRSDTDSKKRVIRALEIAYYQQQHPVDYSGSLIFKTRFIGISVSRQERINRIDNRLKERLNNGMVEEVKTLLDSGIAPEDLIYYGLEYKFVTLFLTGKLSFTQMEEQLSTAIHQFAKRQMTWFRGMERRGIVIEWV
jgi:tRNA dimethylallyltransferase